MKTASARWIMHIYCYSKLDHRCQVQVHPGQIYQRINPIPMYSTDLLRNKNTNCSKYELYKHAQSTWVQQLFGTIHVFNTARIFEYSTMLSHWFPKSLSKLCHDLLHMFSHCRFICTSAPWDIMLVFNQEWNSNRPNCTFWSSKREFWRLSLALSSAKKQTCSLDRVGRDAGPQKWTFWMYHPLNPKKKTFVDLFCS